MLKTTLTALVEEGKQKASYRNYLVVRDAVLLMLGNESRLRAVPSAYYNEESQGFEYLFDASPLVTEKLRHHCHHMTGVKEYEYRAHHSKKAELFKRKLEMLKQEDIYGLFVPEPPQMGGFGFSINGQLVNSDTLKFYECLLALEKGGVLSQFREMSTRHLVVEIGAGWGGLPYMFKHLFPNTTYIIVDLPSSFLFGATYLMTLFPDAKVLFDTGEGKEIAHANWSEYDFVFIPYYLWDTLSLPTPSLVMNTVAFQEMSAKQVAEYIGRAREWQTPYVYSMNRDRSPYNTDEMTTVSEVMSEFYDVRDIEVLPVPIHNFNFKSPSPWTILKRGIKRLLGMEQKKGVQEYRHLIGYARG